MQIAPTSSALAAAPATSSTNPWRFPTLDRDVAQGALHGIEASTALVNRLIDRSIGVRVMLDRDLGSGTFAPDTVRAVELLVDARDFVLGSIEQRHLHGSVVDPVLEWIRASGDERVRIVGEEMHAIRSAVTNLLDDEEGNVSEEIAAMRTAPGGRTWQSIRDGLDGAIGTLYGARDTSSSLHVLRAAGGIR